MRFFYCMKKTAAALFALFAFVLCACQPTPSEDHVVNKGSEAFEDGLIEKPALSTDAPVSSDNIVNDTWQETYEIGHTTIIVDVSYQVHNELHQIVKVRYRDFCEDDINRAIACFTHGAMLSNFTVKTKSRISEQILEYKEALEKIKAGVLPPDDHRSANEQIQELEAIIASLEQEYSLAPDSEVSRDDVNLDFVDDGYGKAVKLYFELNGTEKTLIIRNFSEENATVMRYMDKETELITYELCMQSNDYFTSDSFARATQAASIILNSIGFDEGNLQSSEVLLRKSSEKIAPVYHLVYSRDYGNGEIAFVNIRTSPINNSIGENPAYVLPHEPEKVEIVTDGDSIYSFEWSMPHEVIGYYESELIDISTIKDIAINQLIRIIKGEDLSTTIKITALNMSYTYIKVPDTDGLYYVAPVWDLIGTVGDENTIVSYLTINSVDGSIIDRELN